MLTFRALRAGPITLHRITQANTDSVLAMCCGYADSDYMLGEIRRSYLPAYDDQGRQLVYGFYTTLDDQLAGGSLLGISSFAAARGYTGADTLLHMRGRGVAPGSKPHLFYLGFHLLGLNRIETDCLASNTASRRSIEKTPGMIYEGTLRSYARNPQGNFEDEYRYAILRHDWLRFYAPGEIEVIA
jgi:ribosomal-protein-serine acetyltransferase